MNLFTVFLSVEAYCRPDCIFSVEIALGCKQFGKKYRAARRAA